MGQESRDELASRVVPSAEKVSEVGDAVSLDA